MTKEQKKAANFLWKSTEKQSLQLIAGAGSGKTTTLIETVISCSKSGGDTQEICLITFTKKAAHEMKERLLKKNIRVGTAATMHSLAYRFLVKTKKKEIDIIQNPHLICQKFVREKYHELKHIPSEFLLHKEFNHNPYVSTLKKDYRDYKRKNNLYDFDDLIFECTEMLRQNKIKSPYRIVFVDEFQDTSPSQLSFIQALKPQKLFVVGDDWQSIYKFRGADVSMSKNFSHFFENSTRLFLTKNFRSQKKIVHLGNRAIQLSKEYIPKKLTASKPSGKKPTCLILNKNTTENNTNQAIWKKILHWNQKYSCITYGTILVRTNYERNVLQKVVSDQFDVITLHNSKGLEFDQAIIWGIQDKNIPHQWGDFDEEVRLLYVGITRAKENLQFIAVEERYAHSCFLNFLVSECRIIHI